jgi:hypothetical protein
MVMIMFATSREIIICTFFYFYFVVVSVRVVFFTFSVYQTYWFDQKFVIQVVDKIIWVSDDIVRFIEPFQAFPFDALILNHLSKSSFLMN